MSESWYRSSSLISRKPMLSRVLSFRVSSRTFIHNLLDMSPSHPRNRCCRSNTLLTWFAFKIRDLRAGNILVVSITNPRKRACSAYPQSDACHNPDVKYRIWVVLAMLEYQGYAEDEPCKTRDCAARMDSTKMLECGSTTKTKP